MTQVSIFLLDLLNDNGYSLGTFVKVMNDECGGGCCRGQPAVNTKPHRIIIPTCSTCTPFPIPIVVFTQIHIDHKLKVRALLLENTSEQQLAREEKV